MVGVVVVVAEVVVLLALNCRIVAVAVAEVVEFLTVTFSSTVRALPEFLPSFPDRVSVPFEHFTVPANRLTAGVDENVHVVFPTAPLTSNFSVTVPPLAAIEVGDALAEIVSFVAADAESGRRRATMSATTTATRGCSRMIFAPLFI
jgi:hypothetical protein